MFARFALALALATAPAPERPDCKKIVLASNSRSETTNDTEVVARNCELQVALAHERKWLTSGLPEHAFAAAAAWEARGDLALARDCLARLQVPQEYSQDVISRRNADLKRLHSQLVPVSLAVDIPESVRGLTVSAQRHAEQRARPLQATAIGRMDGQFFLQVHLDPGLWTLRVQGPGVDDFEQLLDVSANGLDTSSPVVLRPAVHDHNPPINLLIQRSQDMARHPVTVAAQSLGAAHTQVSCVIPNQRDTCVLPLYRGTWDLTISAPHAIPQERSLTLTEPTTKPLRVSLSQIEQPAEEDTLPPIPRSRVRVAGGLAIAAGAAAATGIGLAVAGHLQLRRQTESLRVDLNRGSCETPDNQGRTCQANLIAPMNVRATGFGLLASSVGLAAGSFTVRYANQRRVLVPTLVAGTAAIIGGSLWVGLRTQPLDRAFSQLAITGDDVGALYRSTRERAAASALLGAGLGLISASLVSFLAIRPARLMAAFDLRGVSFVGRF